MCVYIYICIIYNLITLLYTWSQHNIVTYLYFNKNGLKKKRKCVIFHQGNARPHISLKTRQKLLTVWLGSSNSFIIAPSDFHLFQFLQDSLNEKNFSSLCVCSVVQSCPTLCDFRDCSPPGSSVHGNFQARILEQVPNSSFRGFSQPRDPTCVSERLWNVPGTVLCSKRFKIWGRWSYEVAQEMAECSRIKWWIFCWIKFLMKMKKINKISGLPWWASG